MMIQRQEESSFGTETQFLRFGNVDPDWKNHLAFTKASAKKWKEKFSKDPYWEPNKTFSQEERKLLERLTPPCFVEDESIIFDTGIGKRKSSPRLHIIKIADDDIQVKWGFCFATDSRLIVVNKHPKNVCQILYKEMIEVVRRSNTKLKIELDSGKMVEITLRIPNKFSVIASNGFRIFAKHTWEQVKAIDTKNDMVDLLEGFFMMIITGRNLFLNHESGGVS